MHVTRFDAAQPYFPPAHFDMRCLRLQGREAGPSEQLWLGMSQILPGGRTDPDASPIEKIYFVVEGDLTVVTPDGETVLKAYDSCRIAPGESRALENKTNKPVMVLLAMPLEPPKAA
ncbi:MAG: cupin domain-containing protein [Beijerinckiaceae bacterium]|jgi:quercetin dioxygenase-like cupin family protein|nr:cupin domain-containing protein [Beijerinckiaceae bacterium]MDO9441436.1 cupin domain-containing protein [Beijerinckiaceae bacterium]